MRITLSLLAAIAAAALVGTVAALADVIRPGQYFGAYVAPGQGGHTDYSDGFVLPGALPLMTVVSARKRPDSVLRATALRLGETDIADLRQLEGTSVPRWSRYIRGVAAGLKASGVEPCGSCADRGLRMMKTTREQIQGLRDGRGGT